MTSESDKNLLVQVQNDYIKETWTQVQDSAHSAHKTLQIGTALIAAFLTVAVSEKQYVLFLFVPLTFGLLLAYQAQQYCDIWAAAWHRMQVINRIEASLGSALFGDDAGITRHGRSNPSVVLNNIAFLCLLYASIVAGFIVLSRLDYATWVWLLYALSAFIGLLASHMAVLESASGWRRAELLEELRRTEPDLTYEQLTDRLVVSLGLPGRLWVRLRHARLATSRRLGRLGRQIFAVRS